MKEDYCIGIDLGTTYSCLAYIDGEGNPVVEKNFEQEDTTPSVVLFNENGEIIVGSPAKDMAVMYPANRTIASVKRQMGTDYKVNIDGDVYTPVTLSAAILKKMINDFNEAHGCDVKKAVITCPAYFGQNERDSTKYAGKIAGLEDVTIINEPTAAAISFGYGGDGSKKRVIVYDLGGGTFDVTILEIEGNSFTAVATDGERLLGGKDWDKALASLIKNKVSQSSGISIEEIEEDKDAAVMLDLDAESIKKRLTTAESTRGTLIIGGIKTVYSVTRGEFESITAPLLNRTLEIIDSVLASKAFTLDDIDDIILVGGSSRMPQIKNGISAKYPSAKVRLFDPDRSIAKGAAIFARSKELNYSDKVDAQKLTVKNVLSKTFGIRVDFNGKEMISNIIYRNETLPIESIKLYYPIEDGQPSVLVEIFENSTLRSDNVLRTELIDGNSVGEFEMALPDGITINTPIKVTFRAADDGTITAEVECMSQVKKYNLKSDLSITENEVETSQGLIERVTKV